MCKAGIRILFCAMLALLALQGLPVFCHAADGPGVIDFYPYAHRLTQDPPPPSSLKAYFRTEIDGQHLILLKTGDPLLTVAVFSAKPVEDIERKLTLRLGLFLPGGKPAGKPAPADAFEWLYLFDRNRDGQFDYLCWPYGPGLVKPPEAPPEVMKKIRFEYLRFVFDHLADDNFDGRFDAAVFGVGSPDNPAWIDRWVLLRSRGDDGTADEAWYFTADIRVPAGEPERVPQGFRLLKRGGTALQTFGSFPEGTRAYNRLLDRFNEAARRLRAQGDPGAVEQ